MKIEHKVTPFLAFRSQAEEAARFYVSLTPGSRIVREVKNPADGTVLLIEFDLAGLRLAAFNGGDWIFTHAFSLSVACESQEEIDRLWTALTDGGQEQQCEWLIDRFGVSWQIVPAEMSKWFAGGDADRFGRVMGAMMPMVKLDIAALQAAYEGSS